MNDLDESTAVDPTHPVERGAPAAMVSDNNVPKPGGRPTVQAAMSAAEGSARRNIISLHLQIKNMKRLIKKGYKYNQYGLVCE